MTRFVSSVFDNLRGADGCYVQDSPVMKALVEVVTSAQRLAIARLPGVF